MKTPPTIEKPKMHTTERYLEDPKTGLVMSDPDQGKLYVAIMTSTSGHMIPVWHPFPTDPDKGHNIEGFMEKWADFVAGDAPALLTVEPRFGHPQYIPRSMIPLVTCMRLEYLPTKDVRASSRLAGIPVIGQLPNGKLVQVTQG